MNAAARLRALLVRPADASTAEGRAQERRRRIVLSALAAGGARAVSLLALLITVPMTLHYLGAERYGLWTAISGLLGVLAFADLGLGFGLVNMLATADGREDRAAAQAAVSSAFFMLLVLAALLALGLLASWPWLDWGTFFNARSAATRAEARAAMGVFLALFLLGLPLSVVTHGFAALQEGFRASFYQGLGSLLGFAGIVAVVKAEGGLPLLVLVASGVPLLASAIGGWDLYFRRRRDLRPSLGKASLGTGVGLAKTAGLFFVVQVSVTVAFQSDGLILARILGPESVAVYSVAQKLFIQVPFVLGYFLAPLWPAYAEALARHDVPWVKRTLKKSIALGFLVNTPAALALFVAAPALIGLWVGGSMRPPGLLLACLAAWAVFNSFNGPLAAFLNGVGALRYLAVTSTLMAAANLALSIAFTRAFGIAGVVMGSLLAQIVFTYLPALCYLPRLMRRLEAGRGEGRA